MSRRDPDFWTDEHQETLEDFRDAVNMAPAELEEWLDTEESRSVGSKTNGGESVGHRSGRRILEIQDKNKPDYSEADVDHMQEVVGYVRRHLAQRPQGDVEETDWRYSLMNWGHDPLK